MAVSRQVLFDNLKEFRFWRTAKMEKIEILDDIFAYTIRSFISFFWNVLYNRYQTMQNENYKYTGIWNNSLSNVGDNFVITPLIQISSPDLRVKEKH